MRVISVDVINAVTPAIIGVSGMVLSVGILVSGADRETKLAVRDIALSAVSISGGALIGSRASKRETNIESVENLDATNPDKR